MNVPRRDSVTVMLHDRFGIDPSQAGGIEVYERGEIDEVFDQLTGWDQERRGVQSKG